MNLSQLRLPWPTTEFPQQAGPRTSLPDAPHGAINPFPVTVESLLGRFGETAGRPQFAS